MKIQSKTIAVWALLCVATLPLQAANELVEIGTAEELAAFAESIKNNHQEVDARLTADIDYTGYDKVIGASCFYCGTFDGQGHKITIKLSGSGDYLGLFNNLGGTGVIKNLIVDGSLTTSGKNAGGLCGQSSGLISHCVSYVTINCTREGDSGHGGFVGQTYNDAKFEYCLSAGKFVSESTTHCGGFVGWKGWGTTMVNSCLEIMEAQLPTLNGCNPFVRGGYTGAHNYYSTSMGDGGDAVSVTADQLASGEACFMLNGDQSNVQWFQTIGTDNNPTPFDTSLQVYANGTFKCDGVTSMGVATYSNEEGKVVILPHTFEDGVCTVCHFIDPSYCEMAEGAYLIGDASQLSWFTSVVASGKASANARLTADIDFTSYEKVIGGTYTGTFDGQGHTLTIALSSEADNLGFFSNLGGTGIIKNLTMAGTITAGGKNAGGFCGLSSGLISHCVNLVIINSTHEGDSGQGGFVGMTYNDAKFEYCVSAGKFVSETTTHCGGFVGWKGWGTTMVNSCLEIMDVELPSITGSGPFVRGGYTGNGNNHYVTHMGDDSNAKQMTPEQAASGEGCYILNGDQSDVQWYQNIGEDEFPLPYATHGTVYLLGEHIFMDVHDDDSFMKFRYRLADEETAYAEGVLATAAMIEDYENYLSEMGEIENREPFMEAYKILLEKKRLLQASADAYAQYEQKVNDVKAFLEENTKFTGRYRTLLETYLSEYVEPNEEYPLGSYSYIVKHHTLTTEEILAETERVQAMLDTAVAEDYVPGTDVTSLLTNADFKDGFNGWEGKPATGTETSPTTGMVGAECWNSTFDMYQTLKNVKPGLYLFSMTAAFRPHDTMTNDNLIASIYAGENMVYMPSVIESYIPAGEAVDGVNCSLTGTTPDYEVRDDDETLLGYAIRGCVGIANAGSANRALTSIVARSEDGTLTVGMKSPGSGNSNDWTGFSNVRLYYLGSMDEAGERLSDVISGQIARAETLLNYEFSISANYAEYPNFAQALKTRLEQNIERARTAASGEEKYAVIQEFSEVFQEIYDCKMAYIAMLQLTDDVFALADDLHPTGKISDEDYDIITQAEEWAWMGYEDGSISTSEAQALELLKSATACPTINSKGVHEIGNYPQFAYFVKKVNTSKSSLKGVLTADIECEGTNNIVTRTYKGTFDGQGHKIALSLQGETDYVGLFKDLGGKGVIKNLVVDGVLTTSGKNAGGLCGRSSGTISHCANYVSILATREGDSGHGGFVGETYDNAKFEYCLSAGKIESESTTHCGGFVGWKGWGSTAVNSSLQVMNIALPTLEGCNSFVRGGYDGANNYFVTKTGESDDAKQLSADQVLDGEACYLLNGDQSKLEWYQTLTQDDTPVPFDSHAIVLKRENGTFYNEGNSIEMVQGTKFKNSKVQGVYDLSGRKTLSPLRRNGGVLPKGIYIVNGKKVIY